MLLHVMLPLDPSTTSSPSRSCGLQFQYEVSSSGWFESLINVPLRVGLSQGDKSVHDAFKDYTWVPVWPFIVLFLTNMCGSIPLCATLLDCITYPNPWGFHKPFNVIEILCCAFFWEIWTYVLFGKYRHFNNVSSSNSWVKNVFLDFYTSYLFHKSLYNLSQRWDLMFLAASICYHYPTMVGCNL